MNTDEQKSSIERLIEDSNNIAIIPSQVAGYDAFAAALGLFFGIKEKNKNVSLIHPGGVPEGFQDLISDSEIMTDPSLRELVVSIDYHDSPAHKVNYSTQNDVLTLRISPVKNNFKLDNVKTTVKGSDFDLIFVIGAQVKEDLGISYSQMTEEFRKATVINLDNTGFNTKFGNVNIVDSEMSNLSQLVLNLMAKSGFFIGQNTAKALLKGISFRVVN